jgi:hypothetical protein
MAENPDHSVRCGRYSAAIRKAAARRYRGRHRPLAKTDPARAVGASRGPSPVRGRPLLELGDPYFEADEVLGEFAGRAHLHQFFYTRSVNPSLSLCYLLRAFSGYGVQIVHGNSPS